MQTKQRSEDATCSGKDHTLSSKHSVDHDDNYNPLLKMTGEDQTKSNMKPNPSKEKNVNRDTEGNNMTDTVATMLSDTTSTSILHRYRRYKNNMNGTGRGLLLLYFLFGYNIMWLRYVGSRIIFISRYQNRFNFSRL